MDEIVIYEKPTCSKCQLAVELLNDECVPFRRVSYHDTPLSAEKLAELVRKMGIKPQKLLRTYEPVYAELGLKDKKLSDAETIQLMIDYPDLMQRPILERGDTAILGRPQERISEFLRSS